MTLHPSKTHPRTIHAFNRLPEEFLAAHGNKYTYDSAVYLDAKTNIKIYCNSCKAYFEQTPSRHKQGQGCRTCATKINADRQRYTIEDFLEKSKRIHGDKFDYSKSIYTANSSKLIVICPFHGEFNVSPSGHWSSKTGCPDCGVEQIWKTRSDEKMSTEKFITLAQERFEDKYDYSLVNVSNNKDRPVIICDIHGPVEHDLWNFLKSPTGCSKCSIVASGINRRLLVSEFVEKANAVHSSYYDYSLVNFTVTRDTISIICPVHGNFPQIVNKHLMGNGCPSCAVTGFDRNKPAYLYYLKVTTDTNQILYKIGITNRTVEARFNLTDLDKIEIVKQKRYEKGTDALNWETKLKRMYKQYQYKGPDILESGNTELFTEDVIRLYYNKEK